MPTVRKGFRVALLSSAALALAVAPARAGLPAPPPYVAPPVPVTSRAPTAADTSYNVNALWGFNGHVWQYQSISGQLTWVPVDNPTLPLDAIGDYVTAAAVTAAGTGYTDQQTVTLQGGVVLTLTVSSGAVQSAVVTNPTWANVCPIATALSSVASSVTGGSGATFTLTYLKPYGYGGRQLSKCYTSAGFAATRSDNYASISPTFNTNDGTIPYPLMDLYGNTAARLDLPTINDQGGSALNMTNSLAISPTMVAYRQLNGVRSIMFDSMSGSAGIGGGPLTTYSMNATLNIPANNYTMAWVGGINSSGSMYAPSAYPVGMVAAGAVANPSGLQVVSATSTFQLKGAPGIDSGMPSWDQGNLVIGNVSGTTASIYANGTTVIGTNTQTGTLTGAYLGTVSSSASGEEDTLAAIIVPFTLTAAQQNALAISLTQTFALQPQGRYLLAAFGDSRFSSWNNQYQHNLPRKITELMNRPDVHMVNLGKPSQDITATTTAITAIVPTLKASVNGGTVAIMQLSERTNSLITAGQTGADIYAYRKLLTNAAHSAGVQVACFTEPMLNETSTGNTVLQFNGYIQQLNGLINANVGTDCDKVVDLASLPVFNTPGTYATPAYATDGIHQGDGGVSIEAALAVSVIASFFR